MLLFLVFSLVLVISIWRDTVLMHPIIVFCSIFFVFLSWYFVNVFCLYDFICFLDIYEVALYLFIPHLFCFIDTWLFYLQLSKVYRQAKRRTNGTFNLESAEDTHKKLNTIFCSYLKLHNYFVSTCVTFTVWSIDVLQTHDSTSQLMLT